MHKHSNSKLFQTTFKLENACAWARECVPFFTTRRLTKYTSTADSMACDMIVVLFIALFISKRCHKYNNFQSHQTDTDTICMRVALLLAVTAANTIPNSMEIALGITQTSVVLWNAFFFYLIALFDVCLLLVRSTFVCVCVCCCCCYGRLLLCFWILSLFILFHTCVPLVSRST